jgi:hypothetical protein
MCPAVTLIPSLYQANMIVILPYKLGVSKLSLTFLVLCGLKYSLDLGKNLTSVTAYWEIFPLHTADLPVSTGEYLCSTFSMIIVTVFKGRTTPFIGP